MASLKEKKSPNTNLINSVSSLLNDIIIGNSITMPLSRNCLIVKKIEEPIAKIHKMVNSSSEQRMQEAEGQMREKLVDYGRMEEEADSLRREKEVFLRK